MIEAGTEDGHARREGAGDAGEEGEDHSELGGTGDPEREQQCCDDPLLLGGKDSRRHGGHGVTAQPEDHRENRLPIEAHDSERTIGEDRQSRKVAAVLEQPERDEEGKDDRKNNRQRIGQPDGDKPILPDEQVIEDPCRNETLEKGGQVLVEESGLKGVDERAGPDDADKFVHQQQDHEEKWQAGAPLARPAPELFSKTAGSGQHNSERQHYRRDEQRELGDRWIEKAAFVGTGLLLKRPEKERTKAPQAARVEPNVERRQEATVEPARDRLVGSWNLPAEGGGEDRVEQSGKLSVEKQGQANEEQPISDAEERALTGFVSKTGQEFLVLGGRLVEKLGPKSFELSVEGAERQAPLRIEKSRRSVREGESGEDRLTEPWILRLQPFQRQL